MFANAHAGLFSPTLKPGLRERRNSVPPFAAQMLPIVTLTVVGTFCDEGRGPKGEWMNAIGGAAVWRV